MDKGLGIGKVGPSRDLLLYILLLLVLIGGVAGVRISLPSYVFWVIVVRAIVGIRDPRVYLVDALIPLGVLMYNLRLFYLSELVEFGRLPGVLFFVLPISMELRQAERPLSLGIPVIWAALAALVAGSKLLEVGLWFVSLVLISGLLAMVWVAKGKRQITWIEVVVLWTLGLVFLGR